MRLALIKINDLLSRYWAIINAPNYDILALRRVAHHLKWKNFIVIRVRHLDKVSLFVSSKNPDDLNYLEKFNLEIFVSLADNYTDVINDYSNYKKLEFYFDPADLAVMEHELERPIKKLDDDVVIRCALNNVFLN